MKSFDLRQGDYRKKLLIPEDIDEKGCVVLTDPAYSERTHKNRRTGSEVRKSKIPYKPMTEKGTEEFVEFMLERCTPQFWCIFGDEDTATWWRRALKKLGQYTYNTVPWCKPDGQPKYNGDGPASGTEHIRIASETAPDAIAITIDGKEYVVDHEPTKWISLARWSHWPKRLYSRPPAYFDPTESTRGRGGKKSHPGKKPLSLCRKLVLHYSEPGQYVIDPFAGWGTIMEAAMIEGRFPIGCEIDPATCRHARRVLKTVSAQPALPFIAEKQAELFG